MKLLANFEATKAPVDPSKLRVKGGRKVTYEGDTYLIKQIERSPRKNKKYVATVYNQTTGNTKKVHWGHTDYDDYYVHRDKNRRENFQKRHGAIKLKNGKLASEDPRQPSFYATKANWSYMGMLANFSVDEEDALEDVSNDAPIVKRLGRFRNLRTPDPDNKIKRRLSTAELLDLRQGEPFYKN